MKKYIRACILILAVLTLFAVSASAAEILVSGTCGAEGDGSNLTWTIDSEGTLTIEGNGAMADYYIYYDDYSLAPWHKYYCLNIKSATVKEGVTSISDFTFLGCSNLTLVTIPESITSIGVDAFFGCDSLAAITVAENNQNYSNDERGVLFNKDKTELIQYPIGSIAASYDIPEGVTSIGVDAFCDCSSLISMTIPESVTSIDYSAFRSCTNLKNVYYAGSEKSWQEMDIKMGNNYLTGATIYYLSSLPRSHSVGFRVFHILRRRGVYGER